jgi:HSP20 family protein
MQSKLSTLFGRSTGTDGDRTLSLPDWSPLVDVTEDDKEFLIKAELPEVKKEDVKVRVEDGMLRISGERQFEKEETGKKYHRVERAYGSFERCFSLPETCKPNEMTAEYKDGMLTLHVPKSKEITPKAIEVKIQ